MNTVTITSLILMILLNLTCLLIAIEKISESETLGLDIPTMLKFCNKQKALGTAPVKNRRS